MGAAILYYGFPTLLAWPLKMDFAFLGFAIFIVLHSKGGLICGTSTLAVNKVKQIHTIWLWQLLNLATITVLALIMGGLFSLHTIPHVWQTAFFTLDLYAKLCVTATITAIVAAIVLRTHRPLTIVPLFTKGSHAASPLVIFGNTWLRDASSTLGMISFSASVLVLTIPYLHAILPATILTSILLAFSVFKNNRFQHLSRQWCRSGHFAWTLLLLSGIFLSCILLTNNVFKHWLPPVTFFSSGSTTQITPHLAALLFQSLILISSAPLIFRAAPYCQGLSVRTAILSQCLNPYLLLLFISNSYQPWLVRVLETLSHSNHAMHLLAFGLLILSSLYLDGTWFANLLERLFSHEQSHYQARMRPFLSHYLQSQLLLWFLVFSLKLTAVTIIFISTVAAGTLLVYFYFYCFFWSRTTPLLT